MTKNKRSGKKGKALALGMVAALALAGCGGRPDSSSGSGNEGLSFDTRGLTPQQYSIANLTAVDDYGRTVEICDPSDAEKNMSGCSISPGWVRRTTWRGFTTFPNWKNWALILRFTTRTIRQVQVLHTSFILPASRCTVIIP